MRKSSAEAAETRKRILSTASGMFLRNGISATAIADIMVAAGLTQGGFYRHFQSKEHLVAEASAAAFEQTRALFDAVAAGKPPRVAIELIVRHYLNQHRDTTLGYMCPIANLASELRDADQQIKAVATDGYARLVKLFASYLMRLDYSDYVGVAESMVSVLVGAVSLSRVITDPALAEAILQNAQRTVDLILQNAPTSSSLASNGKATADL
ncbi:MULTISPECIES: TetR/AcrR family transcriptional regulator [unclassified Duganella]|uniref:TetR/AcrR family transcriptional regulator n=1 Tax=unclassified Duganella TaxID=2636909 RepID=UPI000E3573C1|nr:MULTISPECIES: TetR/AcrR family transcriptional regulator [unclassified Duganella]RFP15983.1 TetR/AcrR family transcriptional regulator [Duganella sp. BJB475]RFP32853.1 TetR/AcrR family transcriptional regulator [Duganella sp. BJB476]